MAMEPNILNFFEPVTATWQYIISDPTTGDAVIIDSVLDFDPATNRISTNSADALLDAIEKNNLQVSKIMETHAHADHLTASRYLQQKLCLSGQPRPEVCIGKGISVVQETFAGRYEIDEADLEGAFDRVFDDEEEFAVGSIKGRIMHLPGHTPDHIGYQIGENVFAGDSIFNPDVGSARTDFPGGSAHELYTSMQKLLALPKHYRLYTGHDYPPEERAAGENGEKCRAYTTVEEQKNENKHVKTGVVKEEFIRWRSARDSSLGEPRLLHQSLQFNIRGGRLPKLHNGMRLLHVPLKVSEELLDIMKG
jgi:glyoxylase-like metal-dependent hydrolase (beta-lactamase superfamily II)